MGKLEHVRAAAERHTSPGSLVLLLLTLIVFGPRTWDAVRGEPNIENRLAVVQNSAGETLIHDLTLTNQPVSGLRANIIEDSSGAVLCSQEHHNTWHGERNRFWQFSAFTGCPEPKVDYRVCSTFAVHSESGRQRFLGPFCSALSAPPELIGAPGAQSELRPLMGLSAAN